MQYLGLLFTLTLLAVNLWGLMLIAGLYWRNRWFAPRRGPVLAVTLIYAIECHHGLGPTLPGLELLSTALSGALISLSSSLGTRLPRQPRDGLLHQWREEFAPRRLVGPSA